jgi:hypothetical protein
MLTMLETLPGPFIGLDGADEVWYVWEVPGVINSTEVSGCDDNGMWRTPEQAYADLQAYLIGSRLPVLPSIAQLIVHADYWPAQVTHVVRIG